MILSWLVWLVVILALYSVYIFLKKFDHWKNRGLKYVPRENLLDHVNLFPSTSPMGKIKNMYDYYDDRYFGAFLFGQPHIMIKDVELIKKIGIKEFESFLNHQKLLSDEDPILEKNLFAAQDTKWKKLRATLSPAFTGSKMRAMFILMDTCSRQFIKYFNNKNEAIIDVEVRDLARRYTNDVVATCAFGVECDSLEHPDNSFFATGKEIANLVNSITGAIKLVLLFLLPSVLKVFKIRFFPKHIIEYFSSVISETVRVRKEKNIIRPDLINILIEASKGMLNNEKDDNLAKEFSSVEEFDLGVKHTENVQAIESEVDMIAQAFIFFLAGFETVATLMRFVFYELAANPDIQDRLRQEILQTEQNCNQKITYEELLKMKYLDMVISEVLRKWPPVPSTDRICNRSFTIQPELPHEKPFTIEKGESCMIPIFGFHHDSKYYPNPEKFDPERFSDENKHNINQMTYMPFGVGPRNCIGSRFALLETKLLFYRILSNFEIVPTKKSQIPIVLNKRLLNPDSKEGFHFGFKRLVK